MVRGRTEALGPWLAGTVSARSADRTAWSSVGRPAALRSETAHGRLMVACMAVACSAAPSAAPAGAARPIAPLAFSVVGSRRPLLRWELPAGATGARVDVCGDRDCERLIVSFDAEGSEGRVREDLPRGTVFWRVWPRAGAALGAAPLTTWPLHVLGGDARMLQAGLDAGGAHVASGLDVAGGDAVLASRLDVNGDGREDLVVAWAPGDLMAPLAELYLGSPDGPRGTAAVTIERQGVVADLTEEGRASPRDLQVRFSAAGDVDGDGFGDLLIHDPCRQGLILRFGAADGLRPDPTVVEGIGGGAVVAGFDWDGDGRPELLAGGNGRAAECGPVRWLAEGSWAPPPAIPHCAAFLRRGEARGFSREPALALGDLAGCWRAEVTAGGDVDGDRLADVVVDVSGSNPTLVLGRRGTTPRPPPVQPRGAGRYALRSALLVPDFDGDGRADLVVRYSQSMMEIQPPVLAQVHPGRPGGLSPDPSRTLSAPGSILGGRLRTCDFQGDGLWDVAFVRLEREDWRNVEAVVHVFHGDAGGLPAGPDVTLPLPAGVVDVQAGDFDGNGACDLVMAAATPDGARRLLVHRGSGSGLTPVADVIPVAGGAP